MEGDLEDMLETKFKNGMSSQIIRKNIFTIKFWVKNYEKGKCHQDLKPENIFYSYIDDNKKDFINKLGYFGLSKDLVNTKKNLTNCGTSLFKASEVESGNYNNKCDLYCLGIILYMFKTCE